MKIKIFLLSMIMMGLDPSLSLAQTLDPSLQWKFNGYASKGQPLGLAPLDSNKMMSADVSGDVSSAKFKSTYTNAVPRTINSKMSDSLNIVDLGAVSGDLASIQKVYDNLSDGAKVEIPVNFDWDGTITTPNPNKRITWIWEGKKGGWYPPPAGDGDTSILFQRNLTTETREFNTTSFSPLISSFYWSDDPKYCGPFCKNFAQYAAISATAFHGPVGTGNVSAINAELDAYDNNPSGSFDVVANIYGEKHNRNSLWGMVMNLTDQSGKIPGAFSSWNEYDIVANGYDVLPWDATFGNTRSHSRVLYFNAINAMPWASWAAKKAYSYTPNTQGSLPKNDTLNVKASDNIQYVWHTIISSGTSGTTEPVWPVPGRVTLSYDKDNATITVSSVTSGTIKIGDYVIGENPVIPFKITAQVSGTKGGAGVYSVDNSNNSADSFTNQVAYTAPHVTDGTVTWEFGEEFINHVSNVFWTSTDSNSIIDDLISGEGNIMNAVLDTSMFTFKGSSPAAIRIGDGQIIDFSSKGTPSSNNKHILFHTSGPYGNNLVYMINGKTAFLVNDDFSNFIIDMPLFTSETISSGGDVLVAKSLYLGTMTKAAILVLSSPKEGQKVFDSDDHEELTYRCPGGTSCGWYPVQYGSIIH